MYVCIYVCMYVCMYVYMYVCMYKFEKFVHLVGFIIGIFHDARYIEYEIVEYIRELYNQARLQNFSEGLYH